MVFSKSARSPSSVFGGKNSKETAGLPALRQASWISRINVIQKKGRGAVCLSLAGGATTSQRHSYARFQAGPKTTFEGVSGRRQGGIPVGPAGSAGLGVPPNQGADPPPASRLAEPASPTKHQ